VLFCGSGGTALHAGSCSAARHRGGFVSP